jgi:hypothetical protein
VSPPHRGGTPELLPLCRQIAVIDGRLDAVLAGIKSDQGFVGDAHTEDRAKEALELLMGSAVALLQKGHLIERKTPRIGN